jgi:hypothetical protein
MLSSTGFDSFRETVAFKSLTHSLPTFLTSNFRLYQSLFLALSPFILLGPYLLAIWCIKKVVNTPLTTFDLAKKFAYSIVPIAVAYNAAHYFSLLALNGPAMIGYLLDPFYLGWSHVQISVNPINAATIWYSQIFLIIAGHVAAIYVAHKIALKTFKNRTQAIKSQYFLLILMVFYTVGSLWIIGQRLISR